MRFTMLLGVIATILVARVETAEACACCDAKFKRTPIGWSAEGALLIDAADTLACETKRRFEVWNVDSTGPTVCYDMFGDPEAEVSCEDINAAEPKQKPKTKSVAAKKKFPKAPTKLAASKFRVKQEWGDSSSGELRVTVELKTQAGWTAAWSGTIGRTDQGNKVSFDTSVWPNAKGDRAVVLLGYIQSGTGNQQVDVHWIPLLK